MHVCWYLLTVYVQLLQIDEIVIRCPTGKTCSVLEHHKSQGLSSVLQSGVEILVDDFDPEAHAQHTLAQKAEDARHHAARMLRQTKVCTWRETVLLLYMFL